jgi:peptidoglycan L-alanyl-D-glutamate endopeptidase CwlK
MVTEGLRSGARQRRLLELGYTKTMNSKHLRHSDGCAHAFDVMAVGDLDRNGDISEHDRLLTWDREIYAAIADAMKRAAAELGIATRWGGDFKQWFDGPHFELVTP